MPLRLSVLFAVVAGLSLTSFGGPEAAGPSAPAVAPMSVDAIHSGVVFRVKHMDAAWFYGRFNKISGEVDLDDKNPAGGSVSVEIDADSIDTADAGRDRHLKSQDFFSVKEFPKITFKSKSVAKKGADWEVSGDLTMHGVTKPVTVTVKPSGSSNDPKGGPRAGFETLFEIKRSDFGMSYGVDKKALGDEVTIMFSVSCVPKK